MTAIETLLATSFEKIFTGFVNDDGITKIKDNLFQQYQITLASSLKDFEKFEWITEKFLGQDGSTKIKKH